MNISSLLVETSTTSNGDTITLRNRDSGEWCVILPESGGRIAALQLSNGTDLYSVLRKIENIASPKRDDIFTNAKLSPFAGRIPDGRYDWAGIPYQLPLNYPEERNACHGFVFDKSFTVVETGGSEDCSFCTLEHSYAGDVEGFPFPFIVQTRYALHRGEGLTCTTRVTNASKQSIPLSDGWHHYFDLGCQVDDIELSMPPVEMFDLGDRGVPTGPRKTFAQFQSPHRLGSRHFDSCFRVDSSSDRVCTRLIDRTRNINLQIWQENGPGQYGYLVVYTPADRKSIAVEPMTGNANVFNNGEGLITLAPGATFSAEFGIMLDKMPDE